MKMEQSLQCVSKGPGGHYVVGLSGNAAAVAEFELLFPEVSKIASLLSKLVADTSSQHMEYNIQSCFNQTRRNIFNTNVISLLNFLSSDRNMYDIATATPLSPTPLHNIMNNQKVDTERAVRFLSLLTNGRKGWKEHRKAVFVEKTKKFSGKLTTAKLPSLGPKPIAQKNMCLRDKDDISPQIVAEAEKRMSMARERGMSIVDILQHDLLPVCPLFEGDLPSVATKSKLVSEISPFQRPYTSNCYRLVLNLQLYISISCQGFVDYPYRHMTHSES